MKHSFLRVSRAYQQGMSLIIVLILLVIVSLIGVASMQIATMSERGARNDRDMQLAWQGAEAALVDAEIDLGGPNSAGNSRTAKIAANPSFPDSGCFADDNWKGFCNATTAGSSKPTWLTVDFTDRSAKGVSVPLGTYTGRTFEYAGDATGKGIQPALAPSYVIEDLGAGAGAGKMVGSNYSSSAQAGTKANAGHLYRITAMGFGPRGDIQAVLQTLYRN